MSQILSLKILSACLFVWSFLVAGSHCAAQADLNLRAILLHQLPRKGLTVLQLQLLLALSPQVTWALWDSSPLLGSCCQKLLVSFSKPTLHVLSSFLCSLLPPMNHIWARVNTRYSPSHQKSSPVHTVPFSVPWSPGLSHGCLLSSRTDSSLPWASKTPGGSIVFPSCPSLSVKSQLHGHTILMQWHSGLSWRMSPQSPQP